MTLVRYNPWSNLDSLHNQLNKILEDKFFEEPANKRGNYNYPPMELTEEEDKYVLHLEVPGIDKKDFDIQVSKDSVAVSGIKKSISEDNIRSEIFYGKFFRTIPIPKPILNEEVVADYDNGILTLTLPKLNKGKKDVVKVEL